MAEISYDSSKGPAKLSGNIFKSLWESFNRQEKSLRFFIVFSFLVLAVTPFLVANRLDLRQRASGPGEFFVQIQPPGPIAIGPNSKGLALSALAYDSSSQPVFSDVTYEWGTSSINSSVTLKKTSGTINEVLPKNLGEAEVYVIARRGSDTAIKTLKVSVTEGGSYPLSFVQIQPPGPITIGLKTKSLPLSALGFDINSGPLLGGVTYEWGTSSINSSVTLKKTIGNITEVLPRVPGVAEVYVIARQGTQSATKTLKVTVASPTPTPNPNDTDNDGFINTIEIYLGTNPNLKCPSSNTPGVPNTAWPPDLTGDNKVDKNDSESFGPYFSKRTGEPGFSPRFDLNKNGLINGQDVLTLNKYMNTSCQ